MPSVTEQLGCCDVGELDFESASRNDALQFAERTLKNLDYIVAAWRENGADVHPVTDLVNSLLGLIVFTKERTLMEQIGRKRIVELQAEGWARWDIQLGQPEIKTLGELVRRLRNAAAHGRIRFSSDDRDSREVVLELEDGPFSGGVFACTFRARITAVDLEVFCRQFIGYVRDVLG